MEQPTMQDDLAAEEHLHWENTVSAISSDPFVYHVNRWTNWHNNSHQIALHQSRPLVRPQPPTEITQAFGNLMAPKIVRKLDDPDLIVRQKAMAWAVEYLSTPENRARCFAAGLLPALMRRFVDKDLCIQRRLALAFKYVAATQSGREEMNQMGAIMELVKLLSSKDCQSRESALEALHDALYSEKAIWMNSNSMTLKAVPVLEPGGSLLFLTKSSNPSVELIAPTAQVDRPDYLQLGAKLEEGEEAYYYGSPESPAGIAVTEVKTLASPAPLNSSQGSSQHGTLNSPQSLASAPPLSDPKIEDVFYSVNRDFEVGEFLSLDALGFASDIDKYAQQEA